MKMAASPVLERVVAMARECTECSTTCMMLTFAALWLVHSILAIFHVDGGVMDDAIKKHLSASSGVEESSPKECWPIAKALEGAAKTFDEGESAGQMRGIISKKLLTYDTLIDSPETLLSVTKACVGRNPGLWTRFTVQYNLYAGSIIAMGNDEQREELIESQNDGTGTLGCFAFTEKAAGVMSGAVMETTAQYDPKTDEFIINSPTDGSVKNWISQGMYAEQAVILAELRIGEESYGPHLFWARIASFPDSPKRVTAKAQAAQWESRPNPVNGVTVESLPEKNALESLDNASIRFDNFRVGRSALLNRYGAVNLDKKAAEKAVYVNMLIELIELCHGYLSMSMCYVIMLSYYHIPHQVVLWRAPFFFYRIL